MVPQNCLKTVPTWNESFLKMLSSKDITLYLMQAAGSDPSAQPDLISSTMPSIELPFQNSDLGGWAMALPNNAITKHTTFTEAILFFFSSGVDWRTIGEFVIVSSRIQWLLYSYFKFRTLSLVPVRIVLICTTQTCTYTLFPLTDPSVRESYLIRIL